MTNSTTASNPNDTVASFAAWFQGLTEGERFAAGRAFRAATGGTLSAWSNPLPVPVALVPVRSADGTLGLLGVRRTIAPAQGQIALPGGFAILGEDPGTAIAREVREETGIDIDPSAFTEIVGMPRRAHNGGWLCFLRCTRTLPHADVVDANARVAAMGDGEASEVVFVTPTTALGFPLHAEAAANFFAIEGARAAPHAARPR